VPANPFSDDFAVYRNPTARTTAPVAIRREPSALTVARAPKPAPLPRQAPRGGAREIAQSLGSALTQTPGGALDLVKMIPGAASAVGHYAMSHTPEQVASDAVALGGRAIEHVREHPESLVDLTPGFGDVKQFTEMVREAADARATGNVAGAQAAERFIGPLAALSIVPNLGMSKFIKGGERLLSGGLRGAADVAADAAADVAERPRYITHEEGPFLHVQREGLEPQTVPEAQGASLPKLRGILANPDTNPAATAANQYNLLNLGRKYPGIVDPGTSLEKQGGIARVFDLAASGDPRYKHALFERYGEMFPKLVEGTGAQNYDQLTEAAYNALGDKVTRQFDQLPVSMRYHFGEGEYATPSAMMGDVLGSGNLNVYRGGDPHPFLSRIDPATGLNQNEMFRAVHDFYGHVPHGATFRPGGEELAYASHAGMMDPLEQMALMSETRGQNSWVNYGPANADLYHQMNQLRDEADVLKGLPKDSYAYRARGGADRLQEINANLRQLGGQTQFSPQTPLLLPPEYLDPMTRGGIPDYLRGLITPANPTSVRGVHLSHTPGLTATDPAFYGTGHRGDDWAIRGAKGSPAQHTSFYTGDPGTVVPENVVSAVSPHAYQTQLHGLYDIGSDPDQLVKLAQSYNVKPMRAGNAGAYLPDLTRLVDEYGYKGYHNPDFLGEGRGAANVFSPVEGLEPVEKGAQGFAKGGPVIVLPAPTVAPPRIILPGAD
jgi:hypothetical protein